MNDKRTSGGAIIGGLVALALLLLGAYVAGYYWRSEKRRIGNPPRHTRIFATKWERRLFTPAARIERITTGDRIDLALEEEFIVRTPEWYVAP